MKRCLLLVCLLALAAIPAAAAQVTGLRVEVGDEGERVSVHLTGDTGYRVFRVDGGKPRVAVDLEATTVRGKIALPGDYEGTLIRGVRYGVRGKTDSRLVFDLSDDIEPQNAHILESGVRGGYRLVFDLPQASGQAIKPPVFPGRGQKRVEAGSRHGREGLPVIVVDAGHGGQDPGASGHSGTEEKNLTLRYALALARALEQTGRYHVALTRDDDRYLFLRERVKKAREAHGDLFISLHADSAPSRTARGLSVYTISETASDTESEALAAEENRADVIGGMDLSKTSDDVAGILIDLTERETRAKSAKFADLAIRDLGRSVGLLSNTHRFAGFAVLKAPDIPSVLVEIGFLTNPHEERLLNSRGYEAKVIRGLARAVDEYFKRRK